MVKSRFGSIIEFIRKKSVGSSFSKNELYDFMKSENHKTFITSCDSYLSVLKCNGYLVTVGNNKKNPMFQISITPKEGMTTKHLLEQDNKRKKK